MFGKQYNKSLYLRTTRYGTWIGKSFEENICLWLQTKVGRARAENVISANYLLSIEPGDRMNIHIILSREREQLELQHLIDGKMIIGICVEATIKTEHAAQFIGQTLI